MIDYTERGIVCVYVLNSLVLEEHWVLLDVSALDDLEDLVADSDGVEDAADEEHDAQDLSQAHAAAALLVLARAVARALPGPLLAARALLLLAALLAKDGAHEQEREER